MPVERKLEFSKFSKFKIEFKAYSVFGFNERIIDSYDVDIIVFNGISEDDSPNTTEAIDANLYWCHDSKIIVNKLLNVLMVLLDWKALRLIRR
jgi:hypothetical protein